MACMLTCPAGSVKSTLLHHLRDLVHEEDLHQDDQDGICVCENGRIVTGDECMKHRVVLAQNCLMFLIWDQ
jgi:hypothetical protein